MATELQKLVNASGPHKSWVTRTINSGQKALENFVATPSPFTVKILEQHANDAQKHFNSLTENLLSISSLDPEMADECEKELDGYEKKKDDFLARASAAIGKHKIQAERDLAAPPEAAGGQQAQAQAKTIQFKPNLAAKPTKNLHPLS